MRYVLLRWALALLVIFAVWPRVGFSEDEDDDNPCPNPGTAGDCEYFDQDSCSDKPISVQIDGALMNCVDNTFTLSAGDVSPSGGTYAWNVSGDAISIIGSSSGSSATFEAGSSAGEADITLTYYYADGSCSATVTATVVSVKFTTFPGSVCPQSSNNINVQVMPEGADLPNTWSVSVGGDTLHESESDEMSGTYQAGSTPGVRTLTVTTASGCSDSMEVNVTGDLHKHDSLNVCVGDPSISLVASFCDHSCVSANISWSITNPDNPNWSWAGTGASATFQPSHSNPIKYVAVATCSTTGGTHTFDICRGPNCNPAWYNLSAVIAMLIEDPTADPCLLTNAYSSWSICWDMLEAYCFACPLSGNPDQLLDLFSQIDFSNIVLGPPCP